jgi:hypothetical protein
MFSLKIVLILFCMLYLGRFPLPRSCHRINLFTSMNIGYFVKKNKKKKKKLRILWKDFYDQWASRTTKAFVQYDQVHE